MYVNYTQTPKMSAEAESVYRYGILRLPTSHRTQTTPRGPSGRDSETPKPRRPLWPLEALDCWAGLLLRLPRRNANCGPQGLNMMTRWNLGGQVLIPIQPIHWRTSSYMLSYVAIPCCMVIPENDRTRATTKQSGHARYRDNAVSLNTIYYTYQRTA